MFFNGLSMQPYILAARLCAALPALQIVRRIDGFALRAGVVLSYSAYPFPVTDRFYPFQIVPQLDAMGFLRLELLQFLTGVYLALGAKIDMLLRRACRYPAFLAIRPPFFCSTSMTLDSVLREPESRRNVLEPGRIPGCCQIQGTGTAVQSAYGSELFI